MQAMLFFCFIIDLAEEEVSSTENEEKNKVHYCQQKGSLCNVIALELVIIFLY